METTFNIAAGCILIGPVLALACFVVVWRYCVAVWKPCVVGCICLIAAIAAALTADISFVWPEADVYALCTAYVSYCFLAFSAWKLKPKAARYAIRLATLLPILSGYAAMWQGGGLFLAFLIGDHLTAPTRVEAIENGLICRITGWGYAFSDSGYNVVAYRSIGPLFQQKLTAIRINETHPQQGREEADCSDIAALVRPRT